MTRSQVSWALACQHPPSTTPILSLTDFLAQGAPDTNLQVVSWRSASLATIDLTLYAESPWWRPSPERATLVGRLDLHLRGIVDSEIHPEWREFESDEFSVSRESAKLWAYGPRGTLFGNAPMLRPLEFLTEMADWLRGRDLPRDIRDYCGGHTFTALAEHFSHLNYTVMDGPLPILEQAAQLLRARGIPVQLLPGRPVESDDLLLLEFGASWIVCREAFVEITERPG